MRPAALALTSASSLLERSSAPVLEARDISKTFGGRVSRRASTNLMRAAKPTCAVDRVSLQLHAGRTVALVGESGSGKSTVARLLAHIYPVTDGQVLLDGAPARPRSASARRRYSRHVQMVFQDPFASFNPTHRLGYQLKRSLALHRRRLSRADYAETLDSLIERVHLSPTHGFLQKFPHELSGGQLQRLAIARSLAAEPRVLLADEPVSMLDVSIRLGVLNLLADLRDHDGLGILYITHDIASARYFADDTLVMYHGQLVEGGPSEVVTQSAVHPYTRLLLAAAPDPTHGTFSADRKEQPMRDARAELAEYRCADGKLGCQDCPTEIVDLGGGHWVRRLAG
jgi:peptide/nickel transport system ATP-binding protein